LAERRLWRLDAIINRRGFYVDLDLAKATRKIVHAEQEAIDAEITELTGGRITSINQVAKLQALLGSSATTSAASPRNQSAPHWRISLKATSSACASSARRGLRLPPGSSTVCSPG
jgi:hypothetical protein